MDQVPRSLQRLVDESTGWLEFKCPGKALEKLQPLLDTPGSRPVGLGLRIRALVDLARYAEALVDLEEIRHFGHDPEWADLTEAWCRKRVDDLDGAVACMESLIARPGRSGIGHYNLGCYLALQDRGAQALDHLSIACGMDESFRSLLQTEPDLKSLHGEAAFEALLPKPRKS